MFIYDSPSESESKINAAGISGIQQRKIFGFEIFINNEILAEIDNVEKWFDSIRKITSTEKIDFNSDLTIPDLNGRNIQVPSIH